LLGAVLRFAIETGMRRSELLRVEWRDLDEASRTLRIRMAKNGHPRTIALSAAALAALAGVQRHEDEARIFPMSANALRLAWERLKRRAGIEDLRFHDLRHEAISRLFEKGLNVPEVAVMSGHRDPRMLFRYTHPRPEDIARKLAKSSG
jgi:integrase